MNQKTKTEIDRILNIIQDVYNNVVCIEHLPESINEFPDSILDQCSQPLQKSIKKFYAAETELRKKAEGAHGNSHSISVTNTEMKAHVDHVKNCVIELVSMLRKEGSISELLKENYLYFKQNNRFGNNLHKDTDSIGYNIDEEDSDFEDADFQIQSSMRKKDRKNLSISNFSTPNRNGFSLRNKKYLPRESFLDDEFSYINEEKKNRISIFLSIIIEMKQVWSDRLFTTVEEAQTQNDQKNETAAREKKANADLKALQRELHAERSVREREVSLRENSLNKITEELSSLREMSESEKDAFESVLAEQETLANENFDKMKGYLEDQIRIKTEQIKKQKEENEANEKEQRINRKNSEQTIEDIIMKYDKLMIENSKKLKDVKNEYEKNDKRVEFLQGELNKFKEEEQRRIEEEQKKKEEQERMRLKLQKKIDAVIVLQRMFRKYRKTKEEQKAKLSKSKKKGKSKKKKR